MYGKYFASTFTGSLMGAGAVVHSVWGYVVANTVDSQVELNPRLLAAVIGECTAEQVEKAIEKLCSPDEASRSKEEDGRRLIREGQFAYRVVNHQKYKEIRNEDDRRAYNREKQREHRARMKASTTVNDSNTKSTLSAQEEAEAEEEKEAEEENGSCAEVTQGSFALASPGARQSAFEGLSFPCAGAGLTAYALSAEHVQEWQRLFPGIDVLNELRKALAWTLANPKRRKTYDGVPKFIVAWLSKAQDSAQAGPARGQMRTFEQQKSDNTTAALQRFVEREERKRNGGR